jgi:hypothetical protein
MNFYHKITNKYAVTVIIKYHQLNYNPTYNKNVQVSTPNVMPAKIHIQLLYFMNISTSAHHCIQILKINQILKNKSTNKTNNKYHYLNSDNKIVQIDFKTQVYKVHSIMGNNRI